MLSIENAGAIVYDSTNISSTTTSQTTTRTAPPTSTSQRTMSHGTQTDDLMTRAKLALQNSLPKAPKLIDDKIISSSHVREQGETLAFLRFLHNIKYDHRQRPNANGTSDKPVHIDVSIVIGSIRQVSEISMDYHLEIFFREKWIDERLSFGRLPDEVKHAEFKSKTTIGLHESYANILWHPDTFIPNALKSENPKDSSITHRSLLRLDVNGSILYSRRLSITAECPMDLTMFPFDQQICKLEVESYGYPDTEVVYEWANGTGMSGMDYDANKIKLPDFELEKVLLNKTLGLYATGNYSRLICCFFFTRSSGFCFLQLILPATAVVMTSWISLWMENETTFQDMISVILTLTLLIYSYNTVMPRVSYIKAMDVYLGSCFFFVFFSLIKLAFVKYMRQRLHVEREHSVAMPLIHLGSKNQNTSGEFRSYSTKRNSCREQLELDNGTPATENNNSMDVSQRKYSEKTPSSLSKLLRSTTNREEYRLFTSRFCNVHFSVECMRTFHLTSQFVFPLAFILFCTIYFTIYSNKHSKLDQKCVP